MPMVRECAHEDCFTLTMGQYCLEHELLMAAAQPVAAKVSLTVGVVTSRTEIADRLRPAVESPEQQTASV